MLQKFKQTRQQAKLTESANAEQLRGLYLKKIEKHTRFTANLLLFWSFVAGIGLLVYIANNI
jgi:hypothetical protein